jgi:hypothetical protein
MDDLWAGRFDLADASSVDPIVLRWLTIRTRLISTGRLQRLILSGHTHGGQCKAPFSSPLLPVRIGDIPGEFALMEAGRSTLEASVMCSKFDSTSGRGHPSELHGV